MVDNVVNNNESVVNRVGLNKIDRWVLTVVLL